MDFNEDFDPFPTSLPRFDEPRILDANMTEMLDDSGLEFDPMLYNPPNFFSTPSESPHKSNETGVVLNRTGLDHSSTHSPESLPDSASSDSSKYLHKRNHSVDSSRSGALDGDADTQMAGHSPGSKAIIIGASPIEARTRSPSTDLDTSNRVMESHFDFDSAASSPVAHTDVKPTLNSTLHRPQVMPFRSSPSGGYDIGNGAHPGKLKSSRETSPLLCMVQNQGGRSTTAAQRQQSMRGASDAFVNGAMLDRPSQGMDWRSNIPAGAPNSSNHETATVSNQPAMTMPFASPTQTLGPTQRPRLYIERLPAKSRVETQIPVKMTLHPMPQGISKLHLQSYTVAKAKLMSKPTPEKHPEMLELHAMLVCTSAMQDEAKRSRALALAAGPQPIIPGHVRRSSSGDSRSSEDDKNKPANGGPVHICGGCIERERKRAGRKKLKNPEEEQSWQKDEAMRIIMFNCYEVKDWTRPVPSNNEDVDLPRIQYPNNAGQVDIPMRITCYCRHQEEKMGFQVIFTLRDHQDNVLTQTFTDPIVITDDHKTQAPHSAIPAQHANFPDGVVISGVGNFPQATTQHHGLPSFRQSYSTNDLHGMQQQFNAQHISPFAMPQNVSQTTSATLTPRNLSRPASPSATSGQQHKKRKASSSGRVRANDLAMTKLQTPPASVFSPSNGQSLGPGPSGASGIAPTYGQPQGLPMQHMPLQYNTNPSSPSTADRDVFSPTQRSQSMENLQGLPGVLSAPTSVRPSRMPSPTPGVQTNTMPQFNAQMLTNSLHSVPGTIQLQHPPVINKLTPSEGPKSGGIEVTCLGSGFRQGLEVMFGDSQATTTTYWGENAIVCLVPPALQAGTVPVTFKHNYEQRATSPPSKLAVFKYFDDDEQELMKHALTLVNRQWNGGVTDAGDSARHIINMFSANASFMGGLSQNGSNQGSSQQRLASGSDLTMAGGMDLETATLSCLNLVDLDDSPCQVNLNAQGRNGQSMLHLSASLGYYRLTAGLLARGANPDIRDRNGLSPMHMASLRGHPKTIRKLRSAGADPTLRTLNGFTPSDMATSEQTFDASSALSHYSRSRSAGATPTSHLSRASSLSLRSSRGVLTNLASTDLKNSTFEDGNSCDEDLGGVYSTQPVTPAQIYARSRRNSLEPEQVFSNEESQAEVSSYASMFAANPAMSAWRDQLTAQIQQLQESVHRTLPNLPIPNLPDYQAYPVVRRISQMVPQRTSRPSTANDRSESTREADSHWWELLSWRYSSPPAYEEIYPEKSRNDMSDKKVSALRAVGEALVDRKCEANFDRTQGSSMTVTDNLDNESMTKWQREQLGIAHAKKVKRLRSDRNLFLIWIPLLFLVLGAMLKDRIPQVVHVARLAFDFARDRLQRHVVEIV